MDVTAATSGRTAGFVFCGTPSNDRLVGEHEAESVPGQAERISTPGDECILSRRGDAADGKARPEGLESAGSGSRVEPPAGAGTPSQPQVAAEPSPSVVVVDPATGLQARPSVCGLGTLVMDLPESDGPQTVGMGRVERSGAGLGHSAFSALLDAPARGIAGAPIPLESKSLADGQVNVRHIVHPEYGAGLELNLRLSNPASALQALRDGGSEQRPFVIENMDQDHDGRTNLDTTRSRVLNFQGLGYDTVDPRTIDHRTPDPQDHSQEILRPGRYQVNVLGGSWEALEGKARIRVYGGSRNELETNLREALVHSGLLSITETTGASGRNPELQRSEVFPGYLATSDPDQPQRYRDLGVHYLFVGVPCAEAVISTLQGDGVLSTAERINRGLEPRGKSWQLDLLRDGGDNAYAAMVTEKARGLDFNFDHACYLGQYQLHYSTETLERTDWTAHTSDGFGSRGGLLYGKELVDQIRYEMSNDEWWDQREAMEMGWQTFITYPHNEVLFPKGLSNRHLTGISCQSADSRRQLLDALHQAGIERVAGKPVEEAVQLREKML